MHLGFFGFSRCSTAAAACTFKNRTINLSCADVFNEFFEVCFDDSDARSVDNLDSVAFDNAAARACGLKNSFVDFGAVNQRQAQTSRAAVNFGDVIDAEIGKSRRACAAACDTDARSFLIIGFGHHLDFLVVSFTTGSLQIPFHDKEFKRDKVNDREHRKQRQHHHPACFGIAGQDAVEDKVNQAVGESCTHCNAHDMARRERATCKENVNRKEFFCKEEESEFDRLGDTRQE